MPEVQLEFPHVLVVEELSEKGRANLAGNTKLVQQILQEAMNGVITKDGQWARDKSGNQLSPGHWEIKKLDVGKYKVIHNLGFTNTSLSASIIQSPGSLKIAEHGPMDFTIETMLNNEPTDMPFMFSLIKVISPSVQTAN